MRKNNSKGITLIELLVVLAIMAILSSITFVSVNHVINHNKYEASVNKLRSTIDTCNTVIDTLNQGIGTIAGVEYIKQGETIDEEKFRGMISNSIPSDYEVYIQGNGSIPNRYAESKDIIVIYVDGVGTQPLNRYTDLKVKGGWFISKGNSTPAITFNQTERKGYDEGKFIS